MDDKALCLPEVIEYGNTIALPTWQLNEQTPTGYSRIYYVKEADIHYEDEYDSMDLKPGKLYILPANLPYQAWRLSNRDFICTYLHVTFFTLTVSRMIEMDVQEHTALHYYLKTLEYCIAERRQEMLISLCGGFVPLIEKLPQVNNASPMMKRVVDYINSHMSENITLQQLSHLSTYHPNYFIRLFRSESGLTPYQFILRMKLQRSCLLLKKGHSVADVAQEIGFSDGASFARAFRAHYGLTPQQYGGGKILTP